MPSPMRRSRRAASSQLGHGRDVLVGVHHVIQEAGGEFPRLAQLFPIHAVVGGEVLGQVDRTQAAVLVGSQVLLAAGVGGFQLVQVRDRVGAVGGIQEEHARLAVVVGLRARSSRTARGRARVL